MFKHIPFITRNALRNRRRSILTVASVAVSLCLLGILLSLYTFLLYPQDASPSQALRLIVHHHVSLAQSLPSSYYEKIKSVEGVQAATPWQWFGGTYKDNRDQANNFARFGVDPQEYFNVRQDVQIPPDQKAAFIGEQASCIISKQLADNIKVKIGDRITLQGDIFPVDLVMPVAGIYTDPDRQPTLLFNTRYLQESLKAKGNRQVDSVGAFYILADAPDHVPRVARAIDAMFEDSPAPTKTESEKDFALSFLAFMGNLKLFLAAFSGAVVFTILLVSANTVAMTVRERIRETAIFRTIGFTPGEIRYLILGEAGFLSLIGGVVGSGLATLLCHASFNSSAPFRLPKLTPLMSLGVIAVAVFIGLISAALPAYLASRRKIVDSMRYVG